MQLNPSFVFSSCLMLIVVVSIVGLLQPSLSYAQQNKDSTPCIIYDPSNRLITITCGSASLTDIDNQLKDTNILHKENNENDDVDDTVWLLNAGIIVAENATFYINSTDTKWLKINADGNTENAIEVYGNLKIDSVKITSWNPETNDYAITDDEEEGQIHRPFIRVEKGASGTTDITNSELAYLGYAALVKEDNYHRRSGLVYYGGSASLISGNDIHHNMFGFYSAGVGGLILEDNHVHDNYVYGFDPHTGTHDMMIRNNTVMIMVIWV